MSRGRLLELSCFFSVYGCSDSSGEIKRNSFFLVAQRDFHPIAAHPFFSCARLFDIPLLIDCIPPCLLNIARTASIPIVAFLNFDLLGIVHPTLSPLFPQGKAHTHKHTQIQI